MLCSALNDSDILHFAFSVLHFAFFWLCILHYSKHEVILRPISVMEGRFAMKAQLSQVPLTLKLALTAFVSVLVPFYLHQYGPANFLWFCDVALLCTLAAVWLESPLLASMQAVAITAPQLLWVADFIYRAITGGHIVDLTEYMFDSNISLFTRGLSLFHGWLPFLLLWLVWRLGYDRRALLFQTLLAWAVLVAAYMLVPGPSSPAGNVNKVFGPSDTEPQTMMAPVLWLGVTMVIYPVCIYVPTHLLLRWLFRPPVKR